MKYLFPATTSRSLLAERHFLCVSPGTGKTIESARVRPANIPFWSPLEAIESGTSSPSRLCIPRHVANTPVTSLDALAFDERSCVVRHGHRRLVAVAVECGRTRQDSRPSSSYVSMNLRCERRKSSQLLADRGILAIRQNSNRPSPDTIRRTRRWERTLKLYVRRRSDSKLVKVALALHPSTDFTGILNRRQQQANHDADDRHHDQQLYSAPRG